MAKSGSTTIQKSIEKFQSDENVLVFRSGRFHPNLQTQASTHFRLAFASKTIATGTNFSRERQQTAIEELEFFRSAKGRSKVISGEGICSLGRAEFESAMEFFEPDRVEVRLVIRNPWDYQSSKFQHNIKFGKTKLHVGPLEYGRKIETFDSESTQLFSFEDLVKSGSLVKTVIPEVTVPDAVPQNRGLTSAGLALIWRTNLAEKHLNLSLTQNDRKIIRKIAGELPGRKFRLHPTDCGITDANLPDYGFNWKEPDPEVLGHWRMSDFFLPLEKDAILAIAQSAKSISNARCELSETGKLNFSLVSKFATSEIDANFDLSVWLKQ